VLKGSCSIAGVGAAAAAAAAAAAEDDPAGEDDIVAGVAEADWLAALIRAHNLLEMGS